MNLVSLASRRPAVDTQPVPELESLGNKLTNDATSLRRKLRNRWRKAQNIHGWPTGLIDIKNSSNALLIAAGIL